MRRARGPLTEHDLAALRGFEAALTIVDDPAHERCVRQLGARARLQAAMDAAPRHRIEPLPAGVREWLGRRAPAVEHEQRLGWLVAGLVGKRVPEWSMRAVRRDVAPPAPAGWYDAGRVPQTLLDDLVDTWGQLSYQAEPHVHRFGHIDADRHAFRSALPDGWWHQW